MVDTVVIRKYNRIVSGGIDHATIDKSFADLEAALNHNAAELAALASQQTNTVIRAYETPGIHILLQGGKHRRGTIIDAWLQIGDNAELSDIVEIVDVTDSINIKDSEKSGKLHLFTIKKKALNFFETVYLRKTTNKRILVGITLESANEQT